MNARPWTAALLLGAAIVSLPGCEHPRKESPRDRITRLRLLHRVSANFYEVKTGKDGKPILVLDLTVTNNGNESLAEVTMRLHVTAPDGKDRLVVPVTLDVSRIKPGVLTVVPPQPGRSAVSDVKPGTPGHLVIGVPGVDVRAGEEITLEMQGQPSADEMKRYGEYRGVS